ncbi:hypothetical protein EOD41_04095 [Mucilaginibacter limnophilus]|uniref:Uncharacterized protein n=1 Tax=Mucilaginibacter limnophilus TaxID=1932778 RepID=A0A3S2Y694_9SPHI|nr:hypothetical protein [Mucilaginibacter limnophilus]RVU03123.1 hypothetical protein EOD41_04095 [Mucilaginibacter limnophilus]
MFTKFTNRNIQQLFVHRRGMINPDYELTDEMYSYGKLSYKWLSMRRKAAVETADSTWNFQFKSLWKTSLEITNQNEEVIGTLTTKVFSWSYTLVMNSGFTAVFRKTSFWKPRYVWENAMQAPIIRIESPVFKATDNIFIEQGTTPVEMIPLLAFLGIHLIIIRRQREAAAASS